MQAMFNFYQRLKALAISKWNETEYLDEEIEETEDESTTSSRTSSVNTNITSTVVTGMSIINPGAGYTSSPAMTIGNVAWGPTGATGWAGISGLSTRTQFNCDVVIIDNNNNEINVGDTLRALIEHTGIVVPNFKLVDKYPSLANAWNEYKSELHKNMNSPELQSALENYKMIASIVKANDVGEN